MFKVGKSLFVAGLLVVASSQATDTPAPATTQAAKGIVAKVSDAASSATTFVTTNISSLCTYLINAGFSKEEVAAMAKEPFTGHSRKFYLVQGTKVAVATAATAAAAYYAYNKVYGKETKSVTTDED